MSDIRVTVTGPAPIAATIQAATGVAPSIRSGDTFRVQLAGVGPTGPRGEQGAAGQAIGQLSQLTDVTLTATADGDVLRYVSGKWQNYPDSQLTDGGHF